MSDPRKPNGRSDEARFARWAHEKLANQSKLGRVSGHRVSNTTHGPVIIPSRTTGGGGATVEMYVLAEPTEDRPIVVEGDYLVCREWDGTTAGATDVYVAKQYKHRCSIEEETVLDVLWTYTYDAGGGDPGEAQNVFRYAENPDEYSEEQRIVPPWVPSRTDGETFIPGDIIYAIETLGTGVIRTYLDDEDEEQTEELTLLDCCSSRQWAKLSIFAVP